MKPLTPRDLWNHETIDTTKPMKPWNHRHHETYETMKSLTPGNLWNHETINTTKPMKPRNTWNYETTDTKRPMKPWLHDTIIIWHRHWHILISINSCTVTPSCNLEMGVGYEANGPSSKHPSSVFLSYYTLHSLYYYMGNFCNLNGLEHW